GLEPGFPDRLPRTPDVLVVGGGMVGVATAVACRRAGLGTVALVERSTLGAGATAGAGGLLVPEAHHDQDSGGIVDLGRLSLALWRELDDLVPDGVGLVDMDWLGLEPGPGLSARLPSGAEMLGAEDVARLVPELARPVDAVLVRQQARVNPLAALARLAGGLDHVATGVDVTEVASIRADLEAALPAVGQARISHAWCCFRPTHPDELPVVDRVPRLANAWTTSGHFRTGILMAPATGRALARWIESGDQP